MLEKNVVFVFRFYIDMARRLLSFIIWVEKAFLALARADVDFILCI